MQPTSEPRSSVWSHPDATHYDCPGAAPRGRHARRFRPSAHSTVATAAASSTSDERTADTVLIVDLVPACAGADVPVPEADLTIAVRVSHHGRSTVRGRVRGVWAPAGQSFRGRRNGGGRRRVGCDPRRAVRRGCARLPHHLPAARTGPPPADVRPRRRHGRRPHLRRCGPHRGAQPSRSTPDDPLNRGARHLANAATHCAGEAAFSSGSFGVQPYQPSSVGTTAQSPHA